MKHLGLESSRQIANRIEMCFNPSIITAVVQVFFEGMAMSGYLDMRWGQLGGSEPIPTLELRICPDCAVRVFYGEFCRYHGQHLPAEASTVKHILNQMVASKKFEEAIKYMRRLFIICGSRTLTADVELVIRWTQRLAPAESFTGCSLPRAWPNGSPLASSVIYFKKLMDKIYASSDSGARPNPLYCRRYVKYLFTEALPCLPLVCDIVAPLRPSSGMTPGGHREQN